MPPVLLQERFLRPNAGFAFNFQFIDVPPGLGPGESAPTPYFYQNIDEAEFAVRMFMYMRLLGYPASRITILTTYNGQKALLEDVVQKHCARMPAFGVPAKIATVDKYQGQQNDYVLLSLVRTRRVGHLRDVRRLVVAMSRARLGLYCLGCRALFEQCLELAPTFRRLLERPSVLALMVRERWGTPGGVPREREGAADAASGGVLVHSLQQMEGVVQCVADRISAEQAAAHAATLAAAHAAAHAYPHTGAAAEGIAAEQPADAAQAEDALMDVAPPDAAAAAAAEGSTAHVQAGANAAADSDMTTNPEQA
jgi:intron-binding protein aquarius